MEYAVYGKFYWLVTGWKTHQKIEKPRYRYPLSESTLKFLPNTDSSSIVQGDVVELSPTNRRLIDPKNKGKENKRKETNIQGVKTPDVYASDSSLNDSCTQIFQYWQKVMKHPKAKLDDKRTKAIQKALQNYSVEDIKLAIDGCANTPHNMGINANGQIYDDIGLILRDSAHVERFINNVKLNNDKSDTSNDWMEGAI